MVLECWLTNWDMEVKSLSLLSSIKSILCNILQHVSTKFTGISSLGLTRAKCVVFVSPVIFFGALLYEKDAIADNITVISSVVIKQVWLYLVDGLCSG